MVCAIAKKIRRCGERNFCDTMPKACFWCLSNPEGKQLLRTLSAKLTKIPDLAECGCWICAGRLGDYVAIVSSSIPRSRAVASVFTRSLCFPCAQSPAHGAVSSELPAIMVEELREGVNESNRGWCCPLYGCGRVFFSKGRRGASNRLLMFAHFKVNKPFKRRPHHSPMPREE